MCLSRHDCSIPGAVIPKLRLQNIASFFLDIRLFWNNNSFLQKHFITYATLKWTAVTVVRGTWQGFRQEGKHPSLSTLLKNMISHTFSLSVGCVRQYPLSSLLLQVDQGYLANAAFVLIVYASQEQTGFKGAKGHLSSHCVESCTRKSN